MLSINTLIRWFIRRHRRILGSTSSPLLSDLLPTQLPPLISTHPLHCHLTHWCSELYAAHVSDLNLKSEPPYGMGTIVTECDPTQNTNNWILNPTQTDWFILACFRRVGPQANSSMVLNSSQIKCFIYYPSTHSTPSKLGEFLILSFAEFTRLRGKNQTKALVLFCFFLVCYIQQINSNCFVMCRNISLRELFYLFP